MANDLKICILKFQESPQAARVKVLASGNATERRFRLDITFLQALFRILTRGPVAAFTS